MVQDSEILILGAGVSGLCTAFHAARHFGQDAVTVLEADDVAGGTARTEHIDGFTCEWGPNGFLDREPKTLEWIDSLGLRDRLVRVDKASAHRFIVKNGRLHEVKPPPGFLFSSLLSVRGRARLLCEPLIRAKRDDGPESIWEFAARRIGREAADMMVTPMVSGIFGGDAKQLSLEHCFPRMAEMERNHGGLFKAMRAMRKSGSSAMGPVGTLSSFREGIGLVAETAAAALTGRIRFGVRATEIRARRGGGYDVQTAAGDAYTARIVVVAIPAFVAASICEPLDTRLSGALQGIAYAGLTVLCTGFRRDQVHHDLNGFGFLVPRVEERRVLGCLWDSSLFPNRAPQGYVLFRSMFGGFTDPEAVGLSEGDLLGYFDREVRPLLRAEGAPELVRVFRHVRGIPQFLLGHGTRLRAVEAAEEHFPGLLFAGNAYRGIGLNDCVLSAHRAVDRTAKALAE